MATKRKTMRQEFEAWTLRQRSYFLPLARDRIGCRDSGNYRNLITYRMFIAWQARSRLAQPRRGESTRKSKGK